MRANLFVALIKNTKIPGQRMTAGYRDDVIEDRRWQPLE
jgi:hypothetical protein